MNAKGIMSGKRWIKIIPIVFITYSLAYLDRTNFGFAVAGGMAEDLNISRSLVSLLGALFFLGYFLFQVPGAHYAATRSVKKLIFWSLILWGSLATVTGLVSNITVLAMIRFTLGIVESAVMPALLILLSRWFTKSERSRANSFLILGNPATMLWMSVLSGYLISWVGWRGMFVLEGIPAVIWAWFWNKSIKDHPAEATWLSEPEKKALSEELQREQQQLSPVKDYRAAFKSPAVLILCLQFACWSIGTYGFMMWLPSVIKTAPGITIIHTGWLSAIAYLFAIVGMLVVSYYSDKTLRRKEFIWVFLLISAVAFYTSYLFLATNFWASYVLLVIAGASICAPFGVFFAMISEMLPSNVAGVATALINSVGALGSFIGSYIVGYLVDSSGGFGSSFLFLSGSMFLASMLIIFSTIYKRK